MNINKFNKNTQNNTTIAVNTSAYVWLNLQRLSHLFK